MVSVPSKASKQMAHSVDLSVNEEVMLKEASVATILFNILSTKQPCGSCPALATYL